MMGVKDIPQIKEDRIIPVERKGVKVISMGFFVENNTPVVWRGPMLGKVLDQFFKDVEWGELDYLTIRFTTRHWRCCIRHSPNVTGI